MYKTAQTGTHKQTNSRMVTKVFNVIFLGLAKLGALMAGKGTLDRKKVFLLSYKSNRMTLSFCL